MRICQRLLRRHRSRAYDVYWRIGTHRIGSNVCQPSYQLCPARHPLHTIANGLRSNLAFFSPLVDVTVPASDAAELAILQRARVHGIESLDQLAVEAGSRCDASYERRLVKDEATRQDLDFWAVLLDYRLLKDGNSGVRDVLEEMLHGGAVVKLQSDSVSNDIWQIISPVLTSDRALLYELLQRRPAFVKDRPFLFVDVVGQLLELGDVRLATALGSQWLLPHFRGRSDILTLFEICFRLGTVVAVENFCYLIKRLPHHLIYSDTVSRLWNAGQNKAAFILHRHCMSLGDYPTTFEQVEPFVTEFATRNLALTPFIRDLECHGISFSHQAWRLYTLTRSQISSKRSSQLKVVLNTAGPGTRPVKLSDPFVARTFATRSVSFEFVLKSLRFVGLYEIGPLAVREMALSSAGPKDLRARFQKLEEKQIDLGSSAYVRTVRSLCFSGNEELLQTVLKSDMHHEVFEDVHTQKRLLTEYSQQNRREELNRTLAILNKGRINKDAEHNSTRLVLLNTLLEGDWRMALAQLDGIRTSYSSLGKGSELGPLRLLLRRIWAGISTSTSTKRDYVQLHQYLVGFMQVALAAGLPVRSWQWRSVLHAVGRSGDWSAFSQLLSSIARLYHKESQTLAEDKEDWNGLNRLFDCKFQCFIIEASLLCTSKGKDAGVAWLQGVNMIVTLQRHFGVTFDCIQLCDAFKNRLEVAFKGVEVQTRSRLIDVYLGSLNWALLQSRSFSEAFAQNSNQFEIVIPTSSALRLFRLRSRLVEQHRSHVDQDIVGNLDKEAEYYRKPIVNGTGRSHRQATISALEFGEGLPAKHMLLKDNSSEVFYEDFLHPSYDKKNVVGVQ